MGAPSGAADQIFVDGAVYTQDAAQPWAEGFAISDGKYFAVGSTAAMRELVGPTTRIVDLRGQMVMSGLIDDHVHAVDGAMDELYSCLFASTATPSRIRKVLTECVKKAPKGSWISGGYWASDFFKHYPTASPRKWLDEIGGERPIILRDDTGHNVWANSAALRLAGVTSDIADPTGGRFERDGKANSPNGIALEAAAERIQAAVPERTAKQYLQSALYAQKIAHKFGIIGFKEADASTPTIAAYQAADKHGRLTLYVATCISTLAMQLSPDTVLNFDEIDKVRAAYHSKLVATDFVKIYLDGVPTAARTAAMLEPYLPDADGNECRATYMSIRTFSRTTCWSSIGVAIPSKCTQRVIERFERASMRLRPPDRPILTVNCAMSSHMRVILRPRISDASLELNAVGRIFARDLVSLTDHRCGDRGGR